MHKILLLVVASALVAVTPQAMADDAPAEAAKTGTATQPASPNSGQEAPSEQGKSASSASSGSDQPLCIQQQ